MAIPYVKQTWVDNNVANPLSAARLGVLETGIFDAHYQPAVRAAHNASQSIGSGAFAALALNSERFDQASNVADTMHDTVTSNSRLTCRYAGVYQITGHAQFAANASGTRIIRIRHSVGSTYIASNLYNNAGAGSGVEMSISTLYALAVNEYVELMVFQDSGGNLNINSVGNYSPEFMMVRVG